MLNRFVLGLITIVLFAGPLHANGDPIVGTVTAVNKVTFTIKDKNNKSIVIMLDSTTKYLMNNKPAQKSDLKAGVPVVVDTHMDTKMKMYSADEVSIGPAPEK